MSKPYKKNIIFLLLLIGVLFFSSLTSVSAQAPNHLFPRRANYFLNWVLSEPEARELAKWDLAVLDMEIQYRAPELLKKMRQWNPNIIILVYITPQEIKTDAVDSFSALRRHFAGGIPDQWYLKNSANRKLTWWPGTYLLNVTNNSPQTNGLRYNQYLVNFVVNKLLGSGLWDGVFYDNAWDNITYFAGRDVDTDCDGSIDSADVQWLEGMKYIYNETRRLAPKGTYIIGNGATRAYRQELDGNMIENFIAPSWTPTMETYKYDSQGNNRVNIVNANTGNRGGENDYRAMRFGLGSALMEDGYYSFDYGDTNHGQLWWYDEYDVNLGEPIGAAVSQNNYKEYKPDVWSRDFEHGLALVNSTDVARTVELGRDYEKIYGAEDTAMNDGSIVSEVSLNPFDGLLVLKTFSILDNVLYTNGAFARFFRPTGERVRNGLFLFDEKNKGSDKVARIDLDNDGKIDFFVSSAEFIQAHRNDGQPLFKEYPYSADYTGEMRVAIGDINGDGLKEICAAPKNKAFPIKIYDAYGILLKDDWFPYGAKYAGGYSVAIGASDDGAGRIIIGAGNGREPTVSIYDSNFKLIKQWAAFEKIFRGGVNVAAGDVDGDGRDEIVVGAGKGKGPIVKIFNQDGKELYKPFTAYVTNDISGVDVRVADVDFNDVGDILALAE